MFGVGTAGCHIFRLFIGDGYQGNFQTVQVNEVTVTDLRQTGDHMTIDGNAATTTNVTDGPASIIVPSDDRMLLIDVFKIHLNIVAAGASQSIFPMGNGQTGAVFKGNMSPHLRLLPEAQQADGTAEQNNHR